MEEVMGIETRVVEESEYVDSEFVEVSRDFFALCTETGNVFYFGEDVDIYEDGVVVSHEQNIKRSGIWSSEALNILFHLPDPAWADARAEPATAI